MTLQTVRPPLPVGVVLDENVYVTMRDGVRLAADVYHPESEGRYPGILSMSPYIKDIQQWPGAISHSIEAGNTAFFVPKGYVHVIVASRGSGLSQGQWSPFELAQQQDGYDMVEWIAQQPWCNGSVTMLGDSYFGIMQWLVGLQRPPHLKCIAPVDASTDFYRDYAWKGGLFNTSFFGMWGPDTMAQCYWPGEVEGKLPPADLFNAFLSHPEDGEFWWSVSSWTRLHELEVPALSIVPQPSANHSRGQLWGYPKVTSPKKLVVLPWNPQSHVTFLESIPLNEYILRWFEHWCKGVENGIMDEPEVMICDSVTQEWRYETEYPIGRAQWSKFFFRSGAGQPATEPPYGLLSREAPGAEAPDSYPTGSRLPFTADMSFDPRTPIETARLISGEPQIAFVSEPLTADLRTWGPMSVSIWAAIDTLDMAFFVKLADVDSDGKRQMISEHVLKASYRELDQSRSTPGLPFHPYQNPSRPQSDEIHEYQIELPPKFWTFKKGHRIWVQISSDDNVYHMMLHTIYTSELLPVPGKATIFHDEEHPSHLLMPVIPDAPEIQPVSKPVADIHWPPKRETSVTGADGTRS
ncbi:MAG: CocE/NonD family hydrolase [Acidimicrobiales bacterium]